MNLPRFRGISFAQRLALRDILLGRPILALLDLLFFRR